MVYFVCGSCNESVKKPGVRSHLLSCRRCSVLTCLDCSVEFSPTSYHTHNKCVSEEQKYSAPGFVAKASSNKGERKQNAWLSQVQCAIDTLKASPQTDASLLRLMLRLRDMSNVPRKQTKFLNFMRNSFRGYQPHLLEKAWDCIKTHLTNDPSVVNEQLNSAGDGSPVVEEKEEGALSKKERKALRRAKQGKVEKKDMKENEEIVGNTDSLSNGKKKGKKRKRQRSSCEDEDIQPKSETKSNGVKQTDEDRESDSESQPSRKKQNKKSVAEGRLNDTLNLSDWQRSSDVETAAKDGKFDWCGTALELLRARGSPGEGAELSLKRLHKAVLRAYTEHQMSINSAPPKSSKTFKDSDANAVKLLGKLDRKLARDSRFLLTHERVQLRIVE